MGLPVVTLEVAHERYGIVAADVVEVVPSVALHTVPGTVPGVVGLLRLRGELVPVVDLGVLWAGRATPARMSSRIVVCALPDPAGAEDGAGPRARPRIGLLAERVLRVATVDPDAVGAVEGPKTPGARGLGRLVPHHDGVLQLVRVDDLVPPDVLASLVRAEGVPS